MEKMKTRIRVYSHARNSVRLYAGTAAVELNANVLSPKPKYWKNMT